MNRHPVKNKILKGKPISSCRVLVQQRNTESKWDNALTHHPI